MWGILRAEWTKLRTLPSTLWLLLAVMVATVALGASAASAVHTSQCPSPTTCDEDTTKLSLTGVHLGQVAVVIFAGLAITGEYGTGTILGTLTTSPRRVRLFLAKALVVTGSVLAAGALGILGSMAAGRFILSGNGFTPDNGYPLISLADATTLRAAGGTVLYLGLMGLLSLGVGFVVRDTAGAITTMFSLLYVFPVLAMTVSDPHWSNRLERYAPMAAGLAIQSTRNIEHQPIGPWNGLGVLAIYTAVATVIATVLFRLRDA